jgi:hypothetical protein
MGPAAFSLFRSDCRADIESGKISGFDLNQTYLFILGSVIEALLLAVVVYHAWALPERVPG